MYSPLLAVLACVGVVLAQSSAESIPEYCNVSEGICYPSSNGEGSWITAPSSRTTQTTAKTSKTARTSITSSNSGQASWITVSSGRASQITSLTTRTATPTPAIVETQAELGQCGGNGWTGPTVCAAGLTCVPISPPWYSQCLYW